MPSHSKDINELLSFYKGKNTEERQKFIIKNLRVETDIVEDDPSDGSPEADSEEEAAA